MSKQQTLVVLRHAITPHNVQIEGSGSAALTTLLEDAEARGMDEAGLMLLLRRELKRNRRAEIRTPIIRRQGRAQCKAVKESFRAEGLTFKVCMRSPYRRTAQTATAVVGRWVKRRVYEGLCERDLGVFHHLPRELFHRFFPKEARKKAIGPLGWKPLDGCSLRDLWPELRPIVEQASNIVRTGERVLIVAHADVNVSLRAMPELGAMTKAQLRQKTGIWNPLWFQNCQYDEYSFGDPRGGRTWDVPTHFRSVVPYGDDLGGKKLATGWYQIKR